MKEIWKDIPGYEGKYQASSEGRIKSLSCVIHIAAIRTESLIIYQEKEYFAPEFEVITLWLS